MTLNTLLDTTSARFPLKTALVFENRSYTYADLSGLTQCLAVSLAQRGINPGDRVAFLLPNSLEIVLCYYACFRLGTIAVPLNIRFPTDRSAALALSESAAGLHFHNAALL